MQNSFLVALSVVAILGKKEDEVSYNKACKEYGRSWIDDRSSRGLLHHTVISDKKQTQKTFSRCEIEHLKQAEKNITEQFRIAERESEAVLNKLVNSKL